MSWVTQLFGLSRVSSWFPAGSDVCVAVSGSYSTSCLSRA